MIISGQILEFEVSVESYSGLLIIDIKYVNKQTNNIYINKQTTVSIQIGNMVQNITNLNICMT